METKIRIRLHPDQVTLHGSRRQTDDGKLWFSTPRGKACNAVTSASFATQLMVSSDCAVRPRGLDQQAIPSSKVLSRRPIARRLGRPTRSFADAVPHRNGERSTPIVVPMRAGVSKEGRRPRRDKLEPIAEMIDVANRSPSNDAPCWAKGGVTLKQARARWGRK
jgi:hypothetical protein